MISLEQVKQLESKVTRTIDFFKKVSEENSRLKEKLDSYQNRIGELEVLIERFKEDQSRIEEGILSALNRLNQFEDALENTLQGGEDKAKAPAPAAAPASAPAATGNKADKTEPRVDVDVAEHAADDDSEEASGDGELDIF